MMNTQEMIDVALELAGLDRCPADASVINPGENIKRVLVGIDMNVQELVVGKLLGVDCVCSHHPRSTNAGEIQQLFIDQKYAMHDNGVQITRGQKLINKRAKQGEDYRLFNNNDRNASASRILNMPYLCIHTPADVIVEKGLQRIMDGKFADKPYTRLSEVIDLLNTIPEYTHVPYKPVIAVGKPDSYAGKIHVLMSGLTGGGPEVYNAYFRAGVGTLVLMHCSEEDIKGVEEAHMGNIINAGHMASDSYGMNRILEQWEKRGVEVIRMSGLVDMI